MTAQFNSQPSTPYSQLLKEYWGYDNFRGIQEDIINSIGEGKDTLGLMPTGGGKSITFQVPALAKEGLCIVITPLISLMKDQVQNLKKRGIKALAIYSGMSRQEIIVTLENCIFGNYKFLYISPERLDTEIFRTKLRKMNVSMITVDESHCISQWGYDFRPAYLKIAEIRDLLPGVPVLALTATATPEVVKDIQARLCFRQENVFRMSFERKNLAYIVRKTENKTGELLHILRRMPGSAIIYVRNRRRTKEITELLINEEITADFYHAGLDDATKELLAHGKSLIELLKQPLYHPLAMWKEVVILSAASNGLLDDVALADLRSFREGLMNYVEANGAAIVKEINETGKLSDESREKLLELVRTYKKQVN